MKQIKHNKQKRKSKNKLVIDCYRIRITKISKMYYIKDINYDVFYQET